MGGITIWFRPVLVGVYEGSFPAGATRRPVVFRGPGSGLRGGGMLGAAAMCGSKKNRGKFQKGGRVIVSATGASEFEVQGTWCVRDEDKGGDVVMTFFSELCTLRAFD